MAWVRAARLAQIPFGQGIQVKVSGRKLALFRVEAGVFAIDALCPHKLAPLAQGQLEGEIVTCPWHDARFELSSGQVLCGPATTGVTSYPTTIRGKKVFVDFPGVRLPWWRRLFGGN